METWMIIQGVGGVGALASLGGAVVAWKRGKKPLAALALVLAAGFAFLVLNATAFVSTPVDSELDAAEAPADDFDAPL